HFTGANFNENGTRPITDAEVEILQRFAHYSILAFDKSIQDVVKWTFKDCKDISKDPKNIEVKPQTKEIVITFRGSDFNDPTNIIADMRSFNLVKYKFKGYQPSSSNEDILVSEGFFTTWQLFHSSNLTNELTSLMKKYPSFNVSATGHSLGGGNELFANYVNKELDCIYRVVSGGDLFSRVPPRPKW
ncbi:35988_t:CDS:2, partial [Racocetra persica]